MSTEYAHQYLLIRILGKQWYLLASLLVLLILFPLLTSQETSRFWRYGLMTLIVITGPLSLASHRQQFLTSIILALAMWIPGWINAVIDTDLVWLTSLTGVAFFVYLAVLIFAQHLMTTDGEVNAETLVAAVNAYLCIGITFAFILFLHGHFQPGAFAGTFMDEVGASDRFAGYIYLSFVTMTTLGYGDITPQTAAAGIAVYILAIAGQLYLALTVARVVGLIVAKQTN